MLQLVEAKARASEIRIATAQRGDDPAAARRPRKLKQIVLNLLTNAVKFSHPGGDVEIVVRVKSAARVAIAVTDHGIGMDAAEDRAGDRPASVRSRAPGPASTPAPGSACRWRSG